MRSLPQEKKPSMRILCYKKALSEKGGNKMELSYMNLREEICDVCHKMWQLGWVAANDGNVSAMLDDGTFLATPTGISKSFITPEKLVHIDKNGTVLEALDGYRPSSEIKMHLRCYEERKDVKAVLHAHPPVATGYAVAHKSLDEYSMIETVVALGSIPVTPYGTPSTYEVPEAIAPYVGLVAIALIIWVFFFKRKSSEKDESSSVNIAECFRRLLGNKKYVFGVITQFFYVGMQISVWTWTVQYVVVTMGVNEAKGSEVYLIAMVLFIVCRWLCTALMKKFDPAKMMAVMAVVGILMAFGTIYLPVNYSICCLIMISGCMSLMFPTIYGIALGGMQEEVKIGASGLIMAILGGAVITPIMGKVIDTGAFSGIVHGFSTGEAAVRSAYLIPVMCFAIIFIYSVAFMKKKNRK